MTLSKEWYKSKTVVSTIALMVLLAGRFFDIQISENEIMLLLQQVTEVILALVALYGRLTAKEKIA